MLTEPPGLNKEHLYGCVWIKAGIKCWLSRLDWIKVHVLTRSFSVNAHASNWCLHQGFVLFQDDPGGQHPCLPGFQLPPVLSLTHVGEKLWTLPSPPLPLAPTRRRPSVRMSRLKWKQNKWKFMSVFGKHVNVCYCHYFKQYTQWTRSVVNRIVHYTYFHRDKLRFFIHADDRNTRIKHTTLKSECHLSSHVQHYFDTIWRTKIYPNRKQGRRK